MKLFDRFTDRTSLRCALLLVSALAFACTARADSDCSFGTQLLRGTYVFAAQGYNIVSGVPQPKGLVEVISFNGDGTLTVPAATVSINGAMTKVPPGGTGTYTVDPRCTGTITFSAGQTFDVFVSPRGEHIWMVQTNPNTVLQGMAVAASAK